MPTPEQQIEQKIRAYAYNHIELDNKFQQQLKAEYDVTLHPFIDKKYQEIKKENLQQFEVILRINKNNYTAMSNDLKQQFSNNDWYRSKTLAPTPKNNVCTLTFKNENDAAFFLQAQANKGRPFTIVSPTDNNTLLKTSNGRVMNNANQTMALKETANQQLTAQKTSSIKQESIKQMNINQDNIRRQNNIKDQNIRRQNIRKDNQHMTTLPNPAPKITLQSNKKQFSPPATSTTPKPPPPTPYKIRK